MLTNYDDFLARAEELGYMPFSRFITGFPSVSSETPSHLWHTGNDHTDPWRWKDRAAEEKRLAYGCILGGNKGFIAGRMYPVFLAAYRPDQTMPERYNAGRIDQLTWRMWQLFEEHRILETHRLRRLVGVSKQTSSKIDAILKRLQLEFIITVAGSIQKVSAKGQLYGWRSNIYRMVEDWAQPSWLDEANQWSVGEARGLILDDGIAMSEGVTRSALAKKLGFP